MTSISSPTYDPTSTATALAQKDIQGSQDILTTQTKAASDTATGLATLGSAISAFQSSLTTLTGASQSVFAQSATFSDPTLGSASASASATPGTYAFFVRQLASASQVSYAGLTDDSAVAGNLVVNLGGGAGGSFTVDLAAANTDGGTLSVREIAAAINGAAGNNSLVTAAVVTTGATSELILSAKNTGANSAISLDTGGVSGASSLAAANADPTRVHQLAAAQDAEIDLGTASGTPIVQSSNTFTNVAGVTMTFTQAQASGAAPVTLSVAANASTTQDHVQAFIDAYNKLKTTLDGLVSPGDPTNNTAAGVFANDEGIRALRERLDSLLRPTGGTSLAAYGITAQRDGTLALDSATLTRKLAAAPTGLDTLIGSTAGVTQTGIAGALNTYLNSWSNGASGQIAERLQANTDLQTQLTDRQSQLDDQYNTDYQRYLTQYTALQTLQGQMSSNASMFDALFGTTSGN